MKTIFLTLLLTLFFGAMINVEAKTPKILKLRLHEQKNIAGTKLTVKFLEMVEDSRCPKGVNCVWAGNAKISIEISKNGKSAKTFELNSNLDPQTIMFEGCKFRLIALDPYPANNIRIDRNGYIAAIEIVATKKHH